MKVAPKVRGFICTTAHPVGCKQNVKNMIDYAKSQPKVEGAKKVLVIGSSMGYGLASRIAASYVSGADTIGVIFDKPGSEGRTGSAGYYNTKAFEEFATADGYYAKSINGDAFSEDIKQQTIDLIKQDLGKVDMVIYSLASPRRTDSDGNSYTSVLKTIGEEYTNKTIDLKTKKVSDITIAPGNVEEIFQTIKVMGGEDWKDWIMALVDNDAIEPDAVTVAYSYVGPEVTHPIYADGTIGRAKIHLSETADEICDELDGIKGYVSVNKALVTQSSAAIPIVPLYISILYKVMKEKNLHEGCIEQMVRLFNQKLYTPNGVVMDEMERIRLDDWELKEEVQQEVAKIWERINDENLDECADLEGYWDDFYKLFGFNIEGVDYDADVDIL